MQEKKHDTKRYTWKKTLYISVMIRKLENLIEAFITYTCPLSNKWQIFIPKIKRTCGNFLSRSYRMIWIHDVNVNKGGILCFNLTSLLIFVTENK